MSYNTRLWHTKPEIGGYPLSLSTVRPDYRKLYATEQTVSCKRREDHCQTPRIQHIHASKAIYCVCLSCIVQIFAPYVAIWWQARGFVCSMCTCRAGSEAKEHHYGLNTTKTKHRLSGAPQSTQLRLWKNRGGGGGGRGWLSQSVWERSSYVKLRWLQKVIHWKL